MTTENENRNLRIKINLLKLQIKRIEKEYKLYYKAVEKLGNYYTKDCKKTCPVLKLYLDYHLPF